MNVEAVITVSCAGCGKEEARIPDPAAAAPAVRELLRNRPAYCDDCLERVTAEEDRQEEIERQEQAARALDRMRQACGLPVAFRGATFESCRSDRVSPHAVDAAQAWATDGRGLVLTGPVGVGKSTLAATALDARNRVLADRAATGRRRSTLRLPDYAQHGVRWLSVPVVFASLAADLDDPRRREIETVLRGARPLVLDDLDKARPTQYGAEQMFLAINQRVEHQTALLVTTNMDLDTLEKRWPEEYGAAIVSRLIGHGAVVGIDGVDRRYPA